jgi:predicted PurR-regulated permease PerM
MSALQPALLKWNLSRILRVVITGTAVFLSFRVTDDVLVGLGVAVVLAMVLDIPWWLYNRRTTQSTDK